MEQQLSPELLREARHSICRFHGSNHPSRPSPWMCQGRFWALKDLCQFGPLIRGR